MWRYNNLELYHHGILGQKWGVRRYQNLDGSLTAAGRARYSVDDIRRDIKSVSQEKSGVFEQTQNTGRIIVDAANELGKQYEDYFNSIHPTSENRKRIVNYLKKELGDGCDDNDLFQWVLGEAVEEEIFGPSMPDIVKKKRNQFESLQKSYWNDVENVSKNFLDKYGDEPVKNSPYSAKQIVNQLISNELDTSIPSYISRHFDDYWVRDTDAFRRAETRMTNSITMAEYNKMFGNLKR